MLLSNGQAFPIAPQALSELVPQLELSYYYPDNIGMELERNFALYGEIYKRNPWVFTVIDKRAKALARLPLEVWNESGDTRELDETSDYAKLIADPCKGFMDPYSFWMWVMSTWDIYGEAFLAIYRRPNGQPFLLLPMHPTRVAIKRDSETGRYTYLFQGGPLSNGDGLIRFDESDVVPFKSYNPIHIERGLSRLEPLRSTLMNEDSSRNATSAMWRNGGRPLISLETEKVLGPDGRSNLQASYQAIHAGTSNYGKALILEQGVTAKPLQLTAKDMEFIDSMKLDREEICAVYDIAPTMVGILEHATFSNISAQMRAFYRDTMAPVIEAVESVIDTYVGAQFGIYKKSKRVARFAVDEVIRGDFEVRAEAGSHLIQAGIATPNEVRHMLGLSRSDDPMADELFANGTIQRLGQPMEQIRLQGELATDPDGIPLQKPAAPLPLPAGQAPKPPEPAAPQAALPSKPPALPAAPAKPKPKPKSLDYSAPHLREFKGGLGRGERIDQLAMRLGEKYPDHLNDILAAVEIAIFERDNKRM